MKQLSILFITLILVLTSCSSDDSIPKTSGNIAGTWQMISYDYRGESTTTAQGQTLTSDFIGEAYDIDYTITFEENPNKLSSDGSFSIELTTTILGQTSTQNIEDVLGLEGLEVVSVGTWEIVNGQLVTTANGEIGNMDILELTESSLILSIKDTQNLSQSGVSIEADIEAIMSFKR